MVYVLTVLIQTYNSLNFFLVWIFKHGLRLQTHVANLSEIFYPSFIDFYFVSVIVFDILDFPTK